ncbi:hypothetical protein EV715DRAFT_208945 [Schizophyllum commune]
MPYSLPWYMRPDYIEKTMSSWSPSDIDWPAVSPGLAPNNPRHDNSGGARESTAHLLILISLHNWTVHGSINLVQLGVRRGVQLSGHHAPVDVAIYTLRSPSTSLPSGANDATGAGPSSPSRPNVSSPARRKDTLGRRNKDCELVHLCPICETTFTRKFSLEGMSCT